MFNSIRTNASETSGSEAGELARALVLPAAICAAGLALFWTLPANAQSFSCAEASTPAEFAICNSENLILLDEELGKVYSAYYVAQPTSPQRQRLSREHDEWIRKRNECGNDTTCIGIRYQERLGTLPVNGPGLGNS